MTQPPPPDPTPIIDLLNAFRTSAAMFTAVSLGVFDLLAEGPLDLEAMAAKLPADADALGRLLDVCVGLKLLNRNGQTVSNTDIAEVYLCKHSPRRMTGYITYSDRVLWKMWANLPDAIREGTNRWKQTFGLDGPLFTNFFRSEEDKREFLWGMHGFGMISSPEVAAAFDLSRFRHLVDLGGATGHLAIACCRRYPTLRATVFDLPVAVPMAEEVIADAKDVSARMSTAAGDFFADPLPPADLYFLGRILHDWDEGKIRRLLARVHEALPPGGALLVGEKIVDDDRAGPRWAQLQSLNMLVCTDGKERTAGEYTVLLREAGFVGVEVRRTSVPLDAILATKAG